MWQLLYNWWVPDPTIVYSSRAVADQGRDVRPKEIKNFRKFVWFLNQGYKEEAKTWNLSDLKGEKLF